MRVEVVAEHRAQRAGLGDVVERGRGAVGVEVTDGGRVDPGVLERALDGQHGAAAVLGRGGGVVGVGGRAGPGDDGLGASAPRAAACSADSSTSTPAPSPMTNPSRSTSNGREAVAGVGVARQRAHLGERADDRAGDAGLDPAGERRRRPRPLRIRSRATWMADAPGGAGGVDGQVGAAGAGADRDGAGGGVRQHLRHEHRADPARPLVEVARVLVLPRLGAADARAEQHADPVRVGRDDPVRLVAVRVAEPGVRDGLAGGDARARWVNRSRRRVAPRPTSASGSNAGTWQAMVTGVPAASQPLVGGGRATCRPGRPCQASVRPRPAGVTSPMPVTTTSRFADIARPPACAVGRPGRPHAAACCFSATLSTASWTVRTSSSSSSSSLTPVSSSSTRVSSTTSSESSPSDSKVASGVDVVGGDAEGVDEDGR